MSGIDQALAADESGRLRRGGPGGNGVVEAGAEEPVGEFHRLVLELHAYLRHPSFRTYETHGCSRSTASDLISAKRARPDRETVEAFVEAARSIAEERNIPVVPARFGLDVWQDRYERLVARPAPPAPRAEPPSGGGRPPTPAEPDTAFRTAYLARLSDMLDRIELYGFSGRNIGRARLLTAYTSLSVTPDDAAAVRSGSDAVLQADGALARSQRLLVRGAAGSGKSTLVRRLAVMAARGAFTGELEPCNRLVPVLLELRDHAGGRLPAPAEFLRTAPAAAVDGMPDGWMDRRLHEGSVLLLVDGMDELPPEEQPQVDAWLAELLGAYPCNRVVVTTRPAVTDEGRLHRHGFTSVTLEPMTSEEFTRFAGRWYRAGNDTRAAALDDPAADTFAAEVLAELWQRPHLAELATNPLLASLICAIRSEHDQLPGHRAEIFQLAVELMVEQRGMDRRVPRARSPFAASRESVMSVLRGLAWLLSERGRTEVSRDQLRQFVTGILAERADAPDVTADEVLDYLLARSGILRVSSWGGTVGFVHRSFQEYLAALAACDEDRIDVLIDRAHLGIWRDTVVLAACRATSRQFRALLEGVIARAEAELHHRRPLWRLAVSCLETARPLPPALRDRLHEAAASVLPPRRRNECHALAAVHEWTLRALPTSLDGLTGEEAGLTVLTAALSGGDRALDLLAGYARQCTREDGTLRSARRELIYAWGHFAPHPYAERVLAALPLAAEDPRDAVDLRITHPGQWTTALRLLTTTAAGLHLTLPCGESVLSRLPDFTSLQRLRIDALAASSDLAPLAGCPELRRLTLAGDGPLPDLAPVTGLPRLEFLALWNWPPFSLDDTPLPQTLTTLGLMGLPLSAELRWLTTLPHLEALALAGGGRPRWTNALAELRDLRELDLGSYDLTEHLPKIVSSAPGLTALGLHACALPADLAPLARLESLKELDLRDVTGPGGTPLDLSPLGDRPPGRRKLKVRVRGRTELDQATLPSDRLKARREL
ncbi:NACHT domain-containing protein [Streptomyces decoyicus]